MPENKILPKAYEMKKAKSNIIDANELIDSILWHVETWVRTGKTYAETMDIAIDDYERRIQKLAERKPPFWESRAKGYVENIGILKTLKKEL